MASQIILGQEGGGSFSLAESLDGITKMVVDARLTQIKEQLNHDLIPQLFALNGWDITDTPLFEYGTVGSESLDEIGKYIQRVAAVGMLPKKPEVVNYITDRLGITPQFKDTTPQEEFLPLLTQYQSGAGEGLVEGNGNGTGKSVSTRDNSVSNLEGAAQVVTIEDIKKAVNEALSPLFNKPTVRIDKATNEMERKALFVVLAPDEVDAHGDTYSAKEIEKAMQSFNKHCMKANLFHLVETQDAEIVQSYTTPVDMYIGDKLVTKGSWVQELYFPETEVGEMLWKAVLSGEINSVSIGCFADVEEIK